MSKEIELSWLREVMGVGALSLDAARIQCDFLKANCSTLAFAEPSVISILTAAPPGYIQLLSGRVSRGKHEWHVATVVDFLGTVYRLDPDCEVVDDTQRWEMVGVFEFEGKWVFWDHGIRRPVTYATVFLRYVCLQVKDAEERVGYVHQFVSKHAYQNMHFNPVYETIEELIASGACIRLVGEVEPTAVVFDEEIGNEQA